MDDVDLSIGGNIKNCVKSVGFGDVADEDLAVKSLEGISVIWTRNKGADLIFGIGSELTN